jgi:hypothetical protein
MYCILSEYQAEYPAILDIAPSLSLNKLFGVLFCSFNLKSVKALGLTIALEVLYQAHRLIC